MSLPRSFSDFVSGTSKETKNPGDKNRQQCAKNNSQTRANGNDTLRSGNRSANRSNNRENVVQTDSGQIS